ncbi:DUF4350 domain-containing protein [Haloterrigena sp. SYSU A558-1]|uniref:DUF4350 domain-containing protein n=1 Tax=Haloterrigena gelatinilytica TaxID=2741724 RepID=A0ABX2LBM0_9EURY|nr:DUF4350 domain-containing protein [Haloterrigena gelatinilytica]NUC72793.1 DUF4350 domain-containing protein [Haloterrigena gelatinilytica]
MTVREWLRDGGGLDWPRVLLAALSATVVVALLVAAATSSAAFGPYNPSWDGTSELRQQTASASGAESELIRDTARYGDYEPNETVAFVVAPDETYADEDVDRIRQFVDNGGTLVVLENFGTNGNRLLADVGAETRTDGAVLRDEQEYYRGPTMPVATGVENHTYTEGVDQLTLNYASALETDEEEATVLVRTSEYAYRDVNRNDELDDNETLDSYPVAAVENVSEGQVVVVGDPSIAINAMIDEPDNAAFLQRLSADADHVLIDLSHSEDLPPLTAAVLTVRELPLLQVLLGAAGIAGIATLSRRRLRPSLERVRTRLARRNDPADASVAVPSADDVDERRAAALRDRHPDWDEDRVRRVIAALNRDDMEPDDQ